MTKLVRFMKTGALGLGITLASLSLPAHADAYPDKPITIVVGFPPGGASDVITRVIGTQMQVLLKQPVIVKNQGGVNGNMASEAFAKATPDGYTLMLGTIANAINGSMLKNVRHDAEKAFTPIVEFQASPSVLVVNPQLPVKTLQELIVLAKQKPGMTYASNGAGSSPHLAAEMLKQRAGIDLLHVPYKGAAPAMMDVIAGHVQVAFLTALSAIPNMQDGSLRPLAVAASRRLPLIPDVPTMKEAGLADFEVESWNGLFAPAGTPRDIVLLLNKTVNEILQTPEVRKRIEDMAGFPVGGTPEQFSALLHAETLKWAEVIRKGNIQPD
ncbi:tripartite tricarboxylate transporter substrate binding protein [soil metagenome]